MAAFVGMNLLLWASLAATVLAQLVFNPVNDFQSISGASLSFPLNLDSLFDNRGFGKTPDDADFDGSGSKPHHRSHCQASDTYNAPQTPIQLTTCPRPLFIMKVLTMNSQSTKLLGMTMS